MGKSIYLLSILFLFSTSCTSQSLKYSQFNEENQNWWKMDINNDSVAGVSWNKAIQYLAAKNIAPSERIVIGVLDTDFDLDHDLAKDVLWKNESEIEGNGFDDDNNGYVDDINGWNFLGMKNKDSSACYILMEETRILKKYDSVGLSELQRSRKVHYSYEEVRRSYDNIIASLKSKIGPYKEIEPNYTYVMDTLYKLISNEISLEKLMAYKAPNDTIQGYVDFAKYYYESGYPYEEFMTYLDFKEKSLDICMNLSNEIHPLVDENPEDLEEKYYGNNSFGKNISILEHGTLVAGILANSVVDSTNESSQSIPSFYPIQIMPITFSAIGDFTDKDFFVALQYAIDNGAKIINFSQGKAFSIKPEILRKALKYAEKKDVLVIMSSGNQGINLDSQVRYPQTIARLYGDKFSNLLIVGASNKHVGTELIDRDSNYGQTSVDIFAPGVDIYTSLPYNKYTTKSGTSYAAPIVSNVAALTWSYFPDFTAEEIRMILMKSGWSYDGNVKAPINDEEELKGDENSNLLPFNQLSKSGKLINAFNAIKLAEKKSSR